MTEDEAYKVHIQYTFNAFCKIVIRHAAIDIILKLRRRWEREVSLDYLMNEKFVQLAEPEQLEEYLFTACGQTAVLYHAELAAVPWPWPPECALMVHRHTGGVVPPVLQPGQAVQQNGGRLFPARIAYNSTHGYILLPVLPEMQTQRPGTRRCVQISSPV